MIKKFFKKGKIRLEQNQYELAEMENTLAIKHSRAKEGAEKITHKSAQRNKDEKYERSIKIQKIE